VGASLTSTIGRVPFFICPNCKERSIDDDGLQGLTHQPVACARCGFGFLFQLLDDYYPSPLTGLVATDRNRRILAAGRGVFELTGYPEQELMGKDIVDVLALDGFDAGANPFALALEWGVRRLDQPLELRSRAGVTKPVTVDVFPAYDDDGGLLVALTPRSD
jgi:PAS domain S-box-containing protein